MWLYITLIIIPSVYSVLSVSKNLKSSTFFCLGFSIILFFTLGLRDKIGGDWLNYLFIYENINDYFQPLSIDFLESDYLFDLINWISFKYSLGFHFVNIINSSIFIIGLFLFAIKQKQPSIVLIVAIPYLIIVVSTGYVRQASALAFFLISIDYLIKKKYFIYGVLIITGSLFHKTLFVLLILIPIMQHQLNIGIINIKRIKINYIILFVSLFIISIIFYNYFLKFQFSFIIRNYIGVDQHFTSSGAIYRTIVFIIASILCIFFRNNLTNNKEEKKLYLYMSILVIALTPFVFQYSSAVDRILIYLYPLQLFIFSRVHHIFNDYHHRIFYNIIIIIMSFSLFFFWAYFAKFSKHWIPYNNIFF